MGGSSWGEHLGGVKLSVLVTKKGRPIKGVTILLYAFGIFQQKQVHAAYRKEDF